MGGRPAAGAPGMLLTGYMRIRRETRQKKWMDDSG
jgi:hypothetical protein